MDSTKPPIPTKLLFYSAIPYGVALVASLIFSALFMRYYWKRRERDRVTAIIVAIGLWVSLLTSFLLPIDVFLVSFMKTASGEFKPWAYNVTIMKIEEGVSVAYYALYGLVLLFLFLLLPMAYFAYEELDDDEPHSPKRFVSALKYVAGFLLAVSILLIVGAFIPYKTGPSHVNATDWEVIKELFERMYHDRGTMALSFVLDILMLCGMITLVLYTGFGMSVFPVYLLRGWQSMRAEVKNIKERKELVADRISRLQARENTLSSQERSELGSLEEEQHLNVRREMELIRQRTGFWHKCDFLFRACGIVFGILGIVLGFVIWLSLILVNIDRLLHSLGFHSGYILIHPTIWNPLDLLMLTAQTVFPIDYIFYFLIVIFLVICTIAGVRYLGIWCFCIKLFRIRPKRTPPQALILLCAILMLTVLALNVLLYAVLPQYTTYGSQHYREFNKTSMTFGKPMPCRNGAPEEECVMSRASVFIMQYALKAWVFGLIYFWISWAFLLVVVLGFLVSVMQNKKSLITEAVDRDDFEESDSDAQPLRT